MSCKWCRNFDKYKWIATKITESWSSLNDNWGGQTDFFHITQLLERRPGFYFTWVFLLQLMKAQGAYSMSWYIWFLQRVLIICGVEVSVESEPDFLFFTQKTWSRCLKMSLVLSFILLFIFTRTSNFGELEHISHSWEWISCCLLWLKLWSYSPHFLRENSLKLVDSY